MIISYKFILYLISQDLFAVQSFLFYSYFIEISVYRGEFVKTDIPTPEQNTNLNAAQTIAQLTKDNGNCPSNLRLISLSWCLSYASICSLYSDWDVLMNINKILLYYV